jgi:hypothetical protein
LGFFSEYYFYQMVLPRSADGGFEGTATAQVGIHWAEDDIAGIDLNDYFGSVTPDETAPELRAGPRSIEPPSVVPVSSFDASGGKARPGQPEQMLPWDILAVEASEPVDGLDTHLSVVTGESESEAVEITGFAPAELLHGASTKNTWSWTRFKDWDSVRGISPIVVVEEGLADAAGHEVTSSRLTVPVLDPGPGLPEHDFEEDMTVLCYAQCSQESGQIEAIAPCNSGLGGLAGRLITDGAKAVKIRLKSSDTVLIDVTGLSGKHYPRLSLYVGDSGDWQDIEMSIDEEKEIGFSIVPNSLCHWTVDTHVFVDHIWAE